MSFTRAKPAGWTDDVDTITAAQLNQIDSNQSKSIDGAAGGDYTPSSPVRVNGSGGFGSNKLLETTVKESLILNKTGGRLVLDAHRVTITGSDVTVRDIDSGSAGSTATLFLVDNTGAGALRTITVKAATTANLKHGEIAIFVFDLPHGTHRVALSSESGGGNPIFQSDPTPSNVPDWAMLYFDTTITGSNPDGEWKVGMHGKLDAAF